MDNEIGISVGIHGVGGINWYQAHSINRRRQDGAMIVFARDDNRTVFAIPASSFAGVAPGIRASFSGELYPDILESPELNKYREATVDDLRKLRVTAIHGKFLKEI